MQPLIGTIEQIEDSVKSLAQKYRKVLELNQELLVSKESNERANDELLEQLDIRGNEIDSLKNEIVKLNAVIAQQNIELNEKAIREEELEVLNNEQRQRIETLEVEVAQMLGKNESYLEKMKELGVARNNLLDSLESDLSSENIIEDLCSEVENQQRVMQELNDRITDLQEQYGVSCQQNENLIEQIAGLKKENISLEFDLEKIRSEFEQASESRLEMNKFKSRSIELNDKLQKVETENEILKAEIANLENQKIEVREAGKQQINSLMTEVNSLRNIALPDNARMEIEETIHQAMRIIEKHI